MSAVAPSHTREIRSLLRAWMAETGPAMTLRARRLSVARPPLEMCESSRDKPPGRQPSCGEGKSALHKKAVRSEEHTSELQSLMRISYAVFCLKKKKKNRKHTPTPRTIHRSHTRHCRPRTTKIHYTPP